VSTPALQNMNALGASCGYLQVNQTLCLPSECATLRVGGNDTCSSILASLDHKISTVTFRSWNPNLNFDCSNIGPFVGKDLCVRYVANAIFASGILLTGQPSRFSFYPRFFPIGTRNHQGVGAHPSSIIITSH
jgi:hypothetical protein